MERNYFDHYEDLSDYMMDKARDGFYSTAVLFYDDAIGLLRELMRHDDVHVISLEISPENYDGYDREYYVSVTEDREISVEPAYVNGRYLNAEADCTLIHSDACSAIIKGVPEDSCHEIYFGTDGGDAEPGNDANWACTPKINYNNKDENDGKLIETADSDIPKSEFYNQIESVTKSILKNIFASLIDCA